MADDVQLTDLQVIQRYSLAVRGASASRAELLETLQADLDWLSSGRRPRKADEETGPDRPAAKRIAKRAPAKRPPAKD